MYLVALPIRNETKEVKKTETFNDEMDNINMIGGTLCH